MERKLLKKNKKRPELIIQTRQETIEEKSFKRKASYKNQVEIKPLMSAKNRHQLRNVFNFPVVQLNPFQFKQKQQNKLKILQRLQSQKVELMKSLQILKEGAVSAIVQKQQQIQKLKEQMYVSSLTELKNLQKQQQQQLNKNLYQKQLQLKECYQKELQQEVQQLRRQLRKERIRYESQLYQKQQMINSLYVELNNSYYKIEELQKQDEYLNEKLKNVELENLSLLKELETSHNMSSSQVLNSSFFLNLSNVTNKSRNKSLPSEDAFSEQSQTIGDLSYASTVPMKRYSQMSNQEDDHFQNSFISQRIEAIRQRHQQEVKEIKQHYQIQINKLKRQYQNKDRERKLSENQSQSILKKIGSSESFQSATYGQKDEESKKFHRYKTGGSSNLIRGEMRQFSMQGIPIHENIESIMQRGQYDEAGTPRNHFSLKQQILEEEIYPLTRHSPNYDTVTTVSNLQNYFNNKNSSQKYLLNYDTISQFTANHFEYPLNTIAQKTDKPFQRTNSVGTFQAQTDDIKTRKIGSVENKLGSYNIPDKVLQKSPSKILSPQSSQPQQITYKSQYSQEDDRMSTKSNHSQKSNASSIKKDIILFCMGLVTGGTLIGVGKKILNK